jgi:hypothetical protein
MKIPITIFKKYPATFMLAAENKKNFYKTNFPWKIKSIPLCWNSDRAFEKKMAAVSKQKDILEP